jgi:protein TonB
LPRRPAQPKPPAQRVAGGDNVVPVRRARRPAEANDARIADEGVLDAAPANEEIAKPRRTAKLAPAGALPPARIPPEALKSGRDDRLLAWTLGVSIAVHLVVLSIHFAPIVVKDLGKGPPLEVALVNAKTKEKPTKADILAQANLDGGGNTDRDRRAKTPLPVMPKESPQSDIAVATKKVEELERRANEMLTQLQSKQAIAVGPSVPEQPAEAAPELPNAKEMMQRTLEAMRLEAQIAKDMDAYQKRPKRRFVGARAEEYRFARYVEDWRLKVERLGNLNYPEAARQNKLYGSLLLTVSIRADGSVEGVEVNKSSGQRILDAAAVRIVEMAAPYAAFPPDIKRDTDILHITRTWTFAKGDELISGQ